MDQRIGGTTLHYAWEDGDDNHGFETGVSLHSHTWNSKESLAFLPKTVKKTYFLPILLRRMEKHFRREWKTGFDYGRGYWTTPVSPEKAYAVERSQIESRGLAPLVSITDHDEISACKGIISLEWTAPYKNAILHIGVHNLPRKDAPRILEELRRTTAGPYRDKAFRDALGGIAAIPDTLIVLNHPLVDQGRIGHKIHASLVKDFIKNHGARVHALELNTFQPWSVNRRVVTIARETGLPLVSGGDRHGFEPNGSINLTAAKTFAGFAREIREEKKSEVLFMPQYREAIALRYARSMEAIMADYPELGPRARWNDRVFYQCPDGITRSVTELAGERSGVVRTTNRIRETIGVINQLAKPIAPILARSGRKSML